jgi:hypothetical protein
MLQSLKAVPMCALLLQRQNHTLDHAVLFWTVWRDEFLLQSITAD